VGAPIGPYRVGFCSACGKDVALKKSDGNVFRHPNPNSGQNVCYGSGKPPSFIYDEDKQDYVKVERPPTPPPPTVPSLSARQGVPQQQPVEDLGMVGLELPVITEAGIVVGRARIEVNRIVILGAKWAQRTA
jgi:hypothetical protein